MSKNEWRYTSTPQYAFMAWCLVKHRGNFTFTVTLTEGKEQDGGNCRKMYPKVSGLAAWSKNYKWYSSLPLGAIVSLFCESV
jgi:hypothetical protein